jgi:putative membrane protein
MRGNMNRTLSSIIGIGAVLALVAGAAWMFQNGGLGGWFCSGYGTGGYGMIGRGMGGGGMIFFWVIVLIGIALLIGSLTGGSGLRRRNASDDSPDALEILKRRYARGEIEKAEYLALRQGLSL